MQSDEHGRTLHDKRTRGEALSDQEQAELEQWYARLDQQEIAALDRMLPSPKLADLEAQVATAILQLQSVTQRIQALTADNAAVRQEIADLQRRLAQKSATQTA
jgi:hypothetical protein